MDSKAAIRLGKGSLRERVGYVSPMTFEQRWTAAQQQDRQSA